MHHLKGIISWPQKKIYNLHQNYKKNAIWEYTKTATQNLLRGSTFSKTMLDSGVEAFNKFEVYVHETPLTNKGGEDLKAEHKPFQTPDC